VLIEPAAFISEILRSKSILGWCAPLLQ